MDRLVQLVTGRGWRAVDPPPRRADADRLPGVLRRTVKFPMVGMSVDFHVQVLRQRVRKEEDFLQFIPPELTRIIDLAGGDEQGGGKPVTFEQRLRDMEIIG